MPRRAVSLPVALPARLPDEAIHRWLYGAIRRQIVDGQLEAGTQLPSTRDLARQYGVSRGAVVTAFETLCAEGFVEGHVGSGTRVAPLLTRARSRQAPGVDEPPGADRRSRRLSGLSARAVLFPQHGHASARAFRANQPALDLFPSQTWARVAARVLRRASTDMLVGSPAMGAWPLRVAIAEYLALSRGVTCRPEQVAVVSGTQEALALAAMLVLDPGETALVEDPGYTGATRLLTTMGARVRRTPVDEEGAVVPPARGAARLAYLTPAHQFPLGTCMTMARRQQWLAWARRTGALLFEDDYDSEYRYSGRPVAALQGLDRDGLVLFAGSFSKTLCAALRLGFLAVPADLVDPLAAIISVTSRHASAMNQAVLAAFMAEGHFARHLRRMRDVYAERHDALVVASARQLQGRLDVQPVEAGLQTVGYLRPGLDARPVAEAAAALDVEVSPLTRYARAPLRRDGVLLGFAAVAPGEIRRGVEALARTL